MWRISQAWPRDKRAGCVFSAVVYLLGISFVLGLLYRASVLGASGWYWLDDRLPYTASVLELVWTMIMGSFLLRVLTRVYRPWRTLREIRARGVDGPIQLTAHSRLVRVLGGMLGFEFFTALGVISMMLPREPTTDLQRFMGFTALAFIFFGGGSFAFVAEATDRYEREILKFYRKAQKPVPQQHLALLEHQP